MTAPYLTYKAFEQDDIVQADPAEVTTGLWSGDIGSLEYFYTSSAQISSSTGDYFVDVYDHDPEALDEHVRDNAELQFSIAYGHIDGGGYPDLADEDTSVLATKATYAQYRNILLDAPAGKFTFAGTGTGSTEYASDHIYVVNIKRARLREKLDPGNWYMPLSGSGSSSHLGGRITLIDDSGQGKGSDHGKAGRVFNIVSGTLDGPDGYTYASASQQPTNGNYGLVYPDLGIMIFNPDALTYAIGDGLKPDTQSLANTYPRNYLKFYEAMKHGYDSSSADFQARSAETISSTHYFIRLRNKEFNYSNNPTFFDPTTGAIAETDFRMNPVVYLTSIGLYNASNECVAIGKVSSPLPKSFAKEILIRVRLDW